MIFFLIEHLWSEYARDGLYNKLGFNKSRRIPNQRSCRLPDLFVLGLIQNLQARNLRTRAALKVLASHIGGSGALARKTDVLATFSGEPVRWMMQKTGHNLNEVYIIVSADTRI